MHKRSHPESSFVVMLFLLVLATGRTASSQSSQPQDSRTDVLRGTVVNVVTHEAIPRALVTSSDNRFATLTDGEGHFEFNIPAKNSTNDAPSTIDDPRAQGLNARKPGFLAGYQDIQSTGNDLTIFLTPEALVIGRAVLPSTEDTERIQVELYRYQVEEGRAHWVSVATVRSRSNGEFRFADLWPGTYKLLTHELLDRDPLTFDPRGQLYGYPPVYFPNSEDFASAQPIQLSAGETFHANVSLVRHAYYRVKLPVVNGQSDAMEVSVFARGRGPGYSLGYDDQEQAITGTLPDGNYTVEVSNFAPNPQSGLQTISVKSAPVEGSRISLAANASIKVTAKEEFTGIEETDSKSNNTLLNPSVHHPQRSFNILLEPADDFTLQRAVFPENPGKSPDDPLVLQHVQPGRYWVRLTSLRGYASQITCGGVDLLRQPLVVGTGGEMPPLEVTLRNDGASIDGTVEGWDKFTNRSPNPLRPEIQAFDSRAHVYLISYDAANGSSQEVLTSLDGKFAFNQLPPGDYRLLAFDRAQKDLEYRKPDAVRAYDSKGVAVTLVAGQKQQLQLQMISSNE